MIRAVSEGFSGYQLCFRENQSWNSTDSELIFLLQNFAFSALFQRKSALFSFVSEKISAETALIQRWFLALKICVFSAVQSWISAVQRFSGNEQRWNRPEIILNQSWSALNVSETSTRIVCCTFSQTSETAYFRIFKEFRSFLFKISDLYLGIRFVAKILLEKFFIFPEFFGREKELACLKKA